MTNGEKSTILRVEFTSAETLVNALDDMEFGICATFADGTLAIGEVEKFYSLDGCQTMVKITHAITGEEVVVTDVRNFTEILVP